MTTGTMNDDADGQSEYRVTWTIDVSASSPEEAAREARRIQSSPDTIADCFSVSGPDGSSVDVDLSEIDGRLGDRDGFSATATIHAAEGVRIDDYAALNAELMGQSGEALSSVYGEHCSGLPGWVGPFRAQDGEILIADADSNGRCRYGSVTQVGGNWSRQVTETIARHLTHGELVIEIKEAGWRTDYIAITSGAFELRDGR